jgi:sugar-phosphatase
MITGESVQNGKPDPEGYLAGAQALGVAPAKCIVVEDAPAGAAACRAAGMQLLALTTTHSAEELEPASLVVADLTRVRVTLSDHPGERLILERVR